MSDEQHADTPAEVAEGTAQEANTVETLPEWAQTLIKETRAEAAKHRTEKNDAVEAGKAETRAEFEQKLAELEQSKQEVETQLNDQKLSQARLRAAFGVVGVDEDAATKAAEVAGLIQGTTEDEITSHADKLSSLFGGNSNSRPVAVDKTPAGKPVALNDDDGLMSAISRALDI